MRIDKLILLSTGNRALVFLFFRHAIVEELVGFGARVHTCCRNQSELDGCLSEWDNLGFGVTGSVCDVSVRSQREELMSTVSTFFDGKLNILVSFFISSIFFTNKNIDVCVSPIGFQNVMYCICLCYSFEF